MNVRSAKISDAKAINALINSYAERDRMLFRSMADIYENLQTFTVAELEGDIVGCCALEIIWADLAEIKKVLARRWLSLPLSERPRLVCQKFLP